MSQASFSIGNISRAAFRAAVNAALQALGSLSSGSSAPSDPYAYQLWYDTGATPNVLKIRNAANAAWVVWGRPADVSLCPFYVGNAEVARFDVDGNLGLGLDTPAHKLDVDGDINVTGAFLVNGTPLSADQPDDSITFAKLQNFTANGVLCRPSGSTGDPSLVTLAASNLLGRGSTGNVSAITLGAGMVMSGTTLAVDHGTTANKVVRLDGVGKLPAVDGSNLTGIGGLVHLGTFEPSGGTIDIVGVLTDDYDVYEFDIVELDMSAAAYVVIRVSPDGGTSYDSGANNYGFAYRVLGETGGESGVGSSGNAMRLTGVVGNDADLAVSGKVTLYFPASTTIRKKFIWNLSYGETDRTIELVSGTGCRSNTAVVNAVRFAAFSGESFTAGKIHVYGRRLSV